MATLLQDLRTGSAINDADLFYSEQSGRNVSQTASAIRAYLASQSTPIPINLTNAEAVAGVQAGQFIPQNPTIQTLSQTSAYTSGNQPILIQGTGFLSTISVTFNGQLTWFCASDSQILCTPPPTTTSGSVSIVITTALGPGKTTTPATTSFTYSQSTIAGTQTNLFRQTLPFSSLGTYRGSPMCLGLDQNVWFSNTLISGGQPGFTNQPTTLVMTFDTSGSPTLITIANGNSATLNASNAFQYGALLTHSMKMLVIGGDGRPWGFDHHGNIAAHNRQNAGEAYSVNIFPLKQSGDSDPGGAPSYGICNGYLFLTGSLLDGSAGVVWKVNPFNPLDQVRRIYPGLRFGPSCVGKNGNMFVSEFIIGGIAQLDSSLNLVGSVTPILGGVPGEVCLGNDLNFWFTTFGSPPTVVKVSSSDLTNQTATNLSACAVATAIAAGPDGNIYIAGSNQFAASPVDSVVFQIDPASGAILNTYTLTGSVGGSPSTHAGGCSGLVVDAQGGICVAVDQDPSASPAVSGYVVRIT